MSQRIGISWRTAAALAAAVVLLPLLVFVDLPESAAHTKTVRRCIVDPPVNHCWDEKVAHTHPKPTPTAAPDPCPPPAHDHGNYGCHWSGDPHTTTPPTTAAPTPTAVPDPCPPPAHDHGSYGCHWSGDPHTTTPPTTAPPPTTKAPPPTTQPPPPTTKAPPPPTTQPPPPECPAGQIGTPPNCVPKQTATYTVKPCTPYQVMPGVTYQRHRHPLGSGTTDTECHHHENSHCPAGQTEHGGHGSQDCRTNDPVDNIFTRVQHLLNQGGRTLSEAIEAVVNDLGETALENAEVREEAGKKIAAWLKQNHETVKRYWNGLPEPVRTGTKAGTCAVILGAAALDPEPTSKVTLIAVSSAIGCAVLIDDVEDLILGSDDGDGDDSSETQPTCQPWPNCRTAKPRDGGGSSTPQTPAPTTTQPPAPTTTQPPFDHTDCHTWLEAIRACIKIDERDGRATITYH